MIFLYAALVLLLSLPAHAQLIFSENWSSGVIDGAIWDSHGGCYSYSQNIVNDPQQAGNPVVRFINTMGQNNSNCEGTWFNTTNHRNELMPKVPPAPNTVRARYKTHFWWGYRLRLASTWPGTQPADRMNISQIIPVFPGQAGTDFKFYVKSDQTWEVEISLADSSQETTRNLGPIDIGVWVNWVFHYYRSRDNDGRVEIWKNGVRILEYTGQTSYTTDDNGWWKFGIYLAAASNTETYTTYVDDIKVANGINQYDIVAPDSVVDPTEPPPPPIFAGGEGLGAEYYISPAGAGTTCSVGTPCSFSTAINLAQPGQSVIFTDGTYNITPSTVRSGTAGNHIVIRGQNPLGALVNGSAPDLLQINHSYITVKDIHFFDTKTGFPSAGNPGPTLVLVRIAVDVHHVILEDNHFEHCANVCIHVPGTGTLGNTHLIIRNNFYDGTGYKNDGQGKHIRLSTASLSNPGSTDMMIYGNEFADFTEAAIDMRPTVNRAWVYDNVFHSQTTSAAHGITPEPTREGLIIVRGSGIQLYRNVIRDSATGTELLRVRLSRTTDSNLIYNNILDSITGNTTAISCETGNTGAEVKAYNNTAWNLASHTVGVPGCTPTTVNNLGIDGVANNLATSGFDSTYFVDAAGGDFRLTSLATGAIDAVTVEPWSNTDFVGGAVIGGIRDYGAYEFGTASPPPPPPPPSGFPTTVVLDDFNRANENPVAGIWTNNAIGSSGSLQVLDNTLQRVDGSNSAYVTSLFSSPDQEVYVTLPNATNHPDTGNVRLLACMQGGVGSGNVDGYALRFRKQDGIDDALYIDRMTNAGFTTLGAIEAFEIDNGDKLGLQILSDGTLNAWADQGSGWTLLFTRNDTTYNCANTNIGIFLGNNPNHADDFGGGNIIAQNSGSLLLAPSIIFFD